MDIRKVGIFKISETVLPLTTTRILPTLLVAVYYPQCCLDAVKCFSCPKLRNICRERHIVRRLCFSTDQKELPNKRGNLKSSYAEVPTYHSNDSESEGKIM